MLLQVADFDEIAVGVAEVHGQYLTRRSDPQSWAFDYVNAALPAQMLDYFIHRCVTEQTKIAAARQCMDFHEVRLEYSGIKVAM